MFRHLLVALDGSEPAQKALTRAIEMTRLTQATTARRVVPMRPSI
jgi:nucleotide-binding universal stress UspA family protein